VKPEANTWVTTRRAFLHGFDSGLTDMEGEFPVSND
jgi:hypothetical protein